MKRNQAITMYKAILINTLVTQTRMFLSPNASATTFLNATKFFIYLHI